MQAEGYKSRVESDQNFYQKEQDQKNSQQNYKIQLSLNEAAYLTKYLPPSYSLQFDSKIQKRSTTTQVVKPARAPTHKKKSADSKLLNEVEPQLNRLPSIRSKKSANIKYNDQINDINYQKYVAVFPQPQLNRRNPYQGLDQSLKPCIKILNLLKNSKTSWPFRQPVDPVAMGIPHYSQIVKQPMDLLKIQNNLKVGQYATPTQFHADLGKIIRNSYSFNKGNLEFTKITEQFQQYYFKIIADPNTDEKSSNNFTDAVRVQKQVVPSNYGAQAKRKKPQRPYSSQVTISLQQKKELSNNIRRLPRQYMKGIVDIVKQQGQHKIKDQFDLQDLKQQTIRELQNYVKSKLFDPVPKIQKGKSNQQKEQNQQSQFQIQSEQDS